MEWITFLRRSLRLGSVGRTRTALYYDVVGQAPKETTAAAPTQASYRRTFSLSPSLSEIFDGREGVPGGSGLGKKEYTNKMEARRMSDSLSTAPLRSTTRSLNSDGSEINESNCNAARQLHDSPAITPPYGEGDSMMCKEGERGWRVAAGDNDSPFQLTGEALRMRGSSSTSSLQQLEARAKESAEEEVSGESLLYSSGQQRQQRLRDREIRLQEVLTELGQELNPARRADLCMIRAFKRIRGAPVRERKADETKSMGMQRERDTLLGDSVEETGEKAGNPSSSSRLQPIAEELISSKQSKDEARCTYLLAWRSIDVSPGIVSVLRLPDIMACDEQDEGIQYNSNVLLSESFMNYVLSLFVHSFYTSVYL